LCPFTSPFTFRATFAARNKKFFHSYQRGLARYLKCLNDVFYVSHEACSRAANDGAFIQEISSSCCSSSSFASESQRLFTRRRPLFSCLTLYSKHQDLHLLFNPGLTHKIGTYFPTQFVRIQSNSLLIELSNQPGGPRSTNQRPPLG